MLPDQVLAVNLTVPNDRDDPAFFAECIARGVKIALGSDAHALREVGDLHAHLALLREAAGSDDVEHLLWSAPWARP